MVTTISGNDGTRTLILGATPPLRQELVTFLRSIPNLHLLTPPQDEVFWSHEITSLDALNVELIILDASAPEANPGTWLRKIRNHASNIPCIVLVSSTRQAADARTSGADKVLLSGFSASEFMEIVEVLL